VIITYLESWQTGETVSYQPPRYLEAVLKEQYTIGWHRFYAGWLSSQREIVQQNYYSVTRSNKTGKRWVSALIQKLWDTAWDLWEHHNGVLHQNENQVTKSMELHLNRRVTRVFFNLCSRAL